MPYGHKEYEEDIAAILNDGPNLINDIHRTAAEYRDRSPRPLRRTNGAVSHPGSDAPFVLELERTLATNQNEAGG